MKTIVITICFTVLALPAFAQNQARDFTVWNNGQATNYSVDPQGNVFGVTPGQPGFVQGNINNGNLYDSRPPANYQNDPIGGPVYGPIYDPYYYQRKGR